MDKHNIDMDDKEATVTYSVRDLLDQIKIAQAEGFARLEMNLAAKADKTDVARLNERLDHKADRTDVAPLNERLDQHVVRFHSLENRTDKLESRWHDREITESVHSTHNEQKWTFRQKAWATVGTLLLITATLLGPLLASGSIHL